ncbi:PrpF domain-containing protein [Bacillus horti]|uniref:2-methylaconitate cis-trans-isomerase PrpF n=1 Tax=Caldalkalibacillus horti TaxID=77523 RepID=A0ABT9VTZ6_9BACI|nr:PrpF domain-containing protein [Bacillus horti]MDQ0164360.1 2-methylaconitate cis-trans-isomerase PrpF [Bacillus horti]
MSQFTVPCVIYRGGTSRGLFFHEKDLPADHELRKWIFLKGVGSEDASHINGLGGASSHTSKAVVISPSEREDIDIDYTFIQLGLGDQTVDLEGTCGNLMAAVGAYAVDEQLVPVRRNDRSKVVRVWSTNMNFELRIHVPLIEGRAKVTGSYKMPGVHDKGAKYVVEIINPGGGKTGETLPLGAQNKLSIGNRSTSSHTPTDIEYSMVDLINPFVYIRATVLELNGTELNQEVSLRVEALRSLEDIRAEVAVQCGFAQDQREAKEKSKAIPKIAYVAPPQDYLTSNGSLISKSDHDILTRMTSMGRMHRSFAVSGLLNLAAACLIPGTIPYQLCQKKIAENVPVVIRIGHPEGVIAILVDYDRKTGQVRSVGLERTARRIMGGDLFIPDRTGISPNIE